MTQDILPPDNVKDQAWGQILEGNTNGVLVILLALLIILIFVGVRMINKKDKDIMKMHGEQLELATKMAVEVERSNDRSQRTLDMLDYLIGQHREGGAA